MIRLSSLLAIVSSLGLSLVCCAQTSPTRLPAQPAATGTQELTAGLEKSILPLVRTYCVSCHDKKTTPPASILLTGHESLTDIQKHRDVWERVVMAIQSKQMPPANAAQPTQTQRTSLVSSLQSLLSRAGCVIHDPGRVTAHRLNRAEYRNTIHDILGLDLPNIADDFPSDDVGYGFDNIGDVLSLSPLHLQKYLRAAGKAAHIAIPTPEDEAVFHQEVQIPTARLSGAGLPDNGGGRAFGQNGFAGFTFNFAAPGVYHLKAVAWEQHGGPEYAKIEFKVAGQSAGILDVTTTDWRKPWEGEVDVTIPEAGRQWVEIGFINDYYNGAKGEDRNVWVRSIGIRPSTSLSLTTEREEWMQNVVGAVPTKKSLESVKDTSVRRFLNTFLLRAYRRPPTLEEVDRFTRLAVDARANGGSYLRGIQAVVKATLISPSFLFRMEKTPASANLEKALPLDDYELAARLSYFLWSSMPDDRLLTLASKGLLHKPAVLAGEARRMLKEPRAEQNLADNFAAQWLQLRKLERITPAASRFPQWNDTLREAMRRETLLYFQHIVAEDRSILEFLDSHYTFMNEPLARLYGNTEVQGPQFRLVNLRGRQRGGLLTQASIMTVTSNPTRTSPVKRGKWILENLLGETVPMPPPGVPQLPDDAEHVVLAGTLRDRLEEHRKNPACASCHQRMDPLGFGLENYNAIGMWRTLEENIPIDARGTLPDGGKFQGAVELRTTLTGMAPKFAHCLSEKLLTYALGRGTESFDSCTIDTIAQSVRQKDYRFSALVEAIVTSKPFLYQRGEDEPMEGTK